jgi:hypothetical protein
MFFVCWKSSKIKITPDLTIGHGCLQSDRVMDREGQFYIPLPSGSIKHILQW